MDAFLAQISLAVSHDALPWLLIAALLAGLTRGFSGFGSGLVFMPVAGSVLPPAQAVGVVVLMDLIGSLPNVPAALRQARHGDLKMLLAGLVPGLALGLLLLFWVAPVVFRWGVSLLALATVAALISGWQWRGARGAAPTFGVGILAGILGGATALPGPPVILYYLSSRLPLGEIRATMTVFMVSVDLALAVMLGSTGQLSLELTAMALIVLLPFIIGNGIGSWLFNPSRTKVYRVGSWVVIGASALYGLPVWQG